jgi:hypothetical protein
LPAGRALAALAAVVLLGPHAGALGLAFLADAPGALGRGHARRRRRHPPSDLPGHRTPSAPRARLERLLRAVFGFVVDMVGEQFIG